MTSSSTGGGVNVVRFIYTGDSRSAVRAMNEVSGTATKTSKRIVVADNEQVAANNRLKGSMGGLKGMIGGLKGGFGFLGLAYGIGASVKAAATFQAEMQTLQTQTGASAKEVSFMTGRLTDMAGQVGIGPSGLARGLYHLESAGLRSWKALKLLKVAAEGAQIGNANLEDVTNALNAAVVSHIKGVKDYSAAMGVLNATVGAGDMRMQDLADAMGHGTLAIAKNFGLSIIDVGAALATFGDNNIRGSQAATMLRMGLSRMLPVSTTAVKAFAAIGLGQTDLAKDMRKPNGLLGALKDLRSHMTAHHLTGADATLQMQQMFGGSRTSAGILTLYNQINRLQTKYDQVTAGAHNFGAAWKTFSHSLKFYIDQFKALGEVILIYVGRALSLLVYPLKALIGFLGGVKNTAIAVGIALATIAAYLAVVKAMAMATKLWAFFQKMLMIQTIATTAATSELGVAMAIIEGELGLNPVMLAFALLAVAIFLVVTHLKLVKQVAVAVFHFVVGIVMAVWNWIKKHWKLLLEILTFPFTGFLLFIIFNFNKIINFLGGLVKGIAKIGAKIWEGLKYGLVTAINWISQQINKYLIGPLNEVLSLGGILGGGPIPSIPMLGGGAQSTGSASHGSSAASAARTAAVNQAFNPSRSSASAIPTPAARGGGYHQPIDIHTHVHMDSRQVAEEHTRYVLRKHAAS